MRGWLSPLVFDFGSVGTVSVTVGEAVLFSGEAVVRKWDGAKPITKDMVVGLKDTDDE